MNIVGKITGIKYKVLLADDLKEIDIENFDINVAPSACLLADNNYTFAISKWVSPKRTRSYPFERVFNTLHVSKKITVIPIVKDEGAKGDRDFIQTLLTRGRSQFSISVTCHLSDSTAKTSSTISEVLVSNRQPFLFKNRLVKNVAVRLLPPSHG